MANMLRKVQQQSSGDMDMTDLKTCTGHDSEEFITWLLSIDKISKLTRHGPRQFVSLKPKIIY